MTVRSTTELYNTFRRSCSIYNSRSNADISTTIKIYGTSYWASKRNTSRGGKLICGSRLSSSSYSFIISNLYSFRCSSKNFTFTISGAAKLHNTLSSKRSIRGSMGCNFTLKPRDFRSKLLISGSVRSFKGSNLGSQSSINCNGFVISCLYCFRSSSKSFTNTIHGTAQRSGTTNSSSSSRRSVVNNLLVKTSNFRSTSTYFGRKVSLRWYIKISTSISSSSSSRATTVNLNLGRKAFSKGIKSTGGKSVLNYRTSIKGSSSSTFQSTFNSKNSYITIDLYISALHYLPSTRRNVVNDNKKVITGSRNVRPNKTAGKRTNFNSRVVSSYRLNKLSAHIISKSNLCHRYCYSL